MPALQPVPKVVRIRMIGVQGTLYTLGSHFTMSYSGSAPTSAQLAAFATGVGNSWATNLAPVTDVGFNLTTVEVIDLTSPTSATVEQPVSHPGTRVGSANAVNICFSLRFLTNLRRRGGRWHIQLRAGTNADLATPSTWTSAFVSAVVAAWQAHIAAVQAAVWSGGGSLQQVGVQYFGPPNRIVTSSSGRVRTASTPLAVPQQFVVTGYGAGTKLGSQRKRLLATGA